uniref:Pathogenicity island effector protein (SPI-2 type III secretion system translocon protein SseC) n=1 Tax=Ganoderma boninense TaxID=34458 RepID=A0A5K1JSC5_9APHY|nr:Putative pathogenicity island effector protein (SPI-2 type III secretion system translocon protein SseC) [Ganoderma boninense]
MSDLRFVRFDNVKTFLETTKQADDYLMKSSGAISIVDYRNGPTDPARVFYLAIYKGEALLITFVYGVLEGFPWVLSVPRRADDLLTPETLTLAATLLANSILRLQIRDRVITDPMKVFGVEEPVNAFLAAWVTAQRARGQRLRLTPNPSTITVTYATRDTFSSLAPHTPPSTQHRIYRASVSDLESLIPFYTALFNTTPRPAPITPTDAVTKLQTALQAGLIWVCRTNHELSAFAELGRVTPRTITIRTAYVAPEHRQRGVAESLVRAVSRYYLGLGTTDLTAVPQGPPPEGVKDRIKLAVANVSAEDAYRRLGFLLPDRSQDGSVLAGGVDPATGRQGWYSAILRGAEPEPEASALTRRGNDGLDIFNCEFPSGDSPYQDSLVTERVPPAAPVLC